MHCVYSDIKSLILKVVLCLVLALSGHCLSAQRFAVGTNFVDWASLATINAEASIAVAQNWSIHVGAELNPWTYRKGDPEKQFELRQMSYWAGIRWWPWHVYSGWWMGTDFRYSTYNLGGVIKRETEEGDAIGGGLYGGYSIMINSWLNLDLGAGVWGGYKDYIRYACPVCGVKVEEGKKAFFIPDARIALMYVF